MNPAPLPSPGSTRWEFLAHVGFRVGTIEGKDIRKVGVVGTRMVRTGTYYYQCPDCGYVQKTHHVEKIPRFCPKCRDGNGRPVK